MVDGHPARWLLSVISSAVHVRAVPPRRRAPPSGCRLPAIAGSRGRERVHRHGEVSLSDRLGVKTTTAYRSWREGALESLQVGRAGSPRSTPGQTVPEPPAGWPRCEHRATTNALSSTARRHGSPGGPAERACRQRGRSRSRLGPMGGVASPRGPLRPERCDHRARRPRQQAGPLRDRAAQSRALGREVPGRGGRSLRGGRRPRG